MAHTTGPQIGARPRPQWTRPRARRGAGRALTAVAASAALVSPGLIGSPAMAATTVIDTQAPTPAANLHSTGTTTSTVALAWGPSSDNVAVDRYEVWQGDADYSAWTLVTTLPATSLSYTRSGLATDTTFTFGLRAFDAAGNKSGPSNISVAKTVGVVTPVTDTSPPSAAQRLKVIASNAVSVSLAWEPATDNVAVHHYEVWRGDAASNNWVLAGVVPAASPTYVNSGLAQSTRYTFAVRAFDAAGNKSASSNAVLALTAPGSGPTPTPTVAPTQTPTPVPTVKPTPTPVPTVKPTPVPVPSSDSTRFYADNSPINMPIPGNAVLDPANDAWVAHARQTAWYLDVIDYSMPIVRASGSERRFTVRTDHDGDWGPAFPAGRTIPLDPAWKQSPGSDGWLTVIDTDGTAYWLWQYSWNNSNPTAAWGGSGPIGKAQVQPWATSGSGTGSGLSPVAGTITQADLQRGVIDHALAFSDTWTASTFKAPANKSDGPDRGSPAMPEGQRVQLDPAINVDAQGWSPIEKMVAKALQTYGAYLVDTSGGSFGLYAQMDQAASGGDPGPMWQAVGVTGDYPTMRNIPMGSLRFMRNWNGS
jgi:Fibronectin type III domain